MYSRRLSFITNIDIDIDSDEYQEKKTFFYTQGIEIVTIRVK